MNGSNNDLLQALVDCVKQDLFPENWGFSKIYRLPNKLTVIYESEFCRVKFALRGSDYGPVFASSVHYGRLHAPDNEFYMNWNGEQCRCWHPSSDILRLTLPFIEGMSPQQIAMEQVAFWQSREESLGVDHPPSDYIEYPLKLHSKIWERYGKRLFNLFDLRQPELWEAYSRFSDGYNLAWHKRWNITRGIERVC